MTIATNTGFDAVAGAGAYAAIALVEAQARSGTLRLTDWPLDVVAMGQSWRGLGNMGQVGELRESDDGAPQKLTLSLSPIDMTNRSFSLGDPSDYQDRILRLWVAMLDAETLQLSGAPVLRFAGVMDVMRFPREDNTMKIELDCRTVSYDVRSNPSALRMNDQQHQTRHPGETGFRYLQSLIGNPAIYTSKAFGAYLRIRSMLGIQ